MAQVIVTESSLENIASAIRSKLNTQDTYKPSEMAGAISQIHGDPVLEALDVRANGTYTPSSGKDGFSRAVVNVPNSYTASDEGKVVSSGTLVAQSSQSITQNGTYDTTLKNQAIVNVPNSYSASDEGKVVDNGALVAQGSQTITENGTYDTTLKNQITVNVSGGGGGDGSFVDPKHISIDADSVFPTLLSGYPQFSGFAAFGGNEKKNWWGANDRLQHWLKVGFEQAEIINAIEFSNGWTEGSSRWQSATVIFQGSNDNSTWVDLLSLTSMTISENAVKYNVNNNTAYLYYRFLCTSGIDSYTGIGKVKLYGKGSGGGSKNILGGTTAPTSADGTDGDIYIKYTDYSDLSGYTPLEYIQSSGTQFITTDYTPNVNTEVKIELSPQVITDSAIMGADWTVDGYFLMFYQNKVRFHTTAAIDSPTVAVDERYIIETDKSGFTLNGARYNGNTASSFANYALSIFNTTHNPYLPSTPGSFKLYSLTISESGTIVKNLIPAKRNSDDALGMYDLVNDVFYTNSGTGAFIGGEELTGKPIDAAYLKVSGAWIPLEDGDWDDVNTGE